MTTQTEKNKNIVIVILIIALIVMIGLYIRHSAPASTAGPQVSGTRFCHPVEDELDTSAIGEYRRSKTDKNETDLVVYEAKDIQNYLSCVWPALANSKKPPTSYHWAVGFYFVRKLIDTATKARKLDFFVTPTLVMDTVDDSIHQPLDFYTNCTNPNYYNHNPKYVTCDTSSGALRARTASGPDSGNSYDAGQLWP